MRKNQVILLHGIPATGKYTLESFLLDNHYFHDLLVHKIELSNDDCDLYFTLVVRLKQQYINILAQFYPK